MNASITRSSEGMNGLFHSLLQLVIAGDFCLLFSALRSLVVPIWRNFFPGLKEQAPFGALQSSRYIPQHCALLQSSFCSCFSLIAVLLL
jgi:hypothetical protein